ncbi:hypothetical protein BJ138DRAFT_1094161 [Hygrophoropsis aurantiaca]|uniref:Uncharacterized protein n=1 Tax=Hygrophoropsis aurantiaca TaxID=72124 RepID=A0ACB8A0A6_9AGAM|nr:hypothetical protein BJ138DRAFT_1094161 [Hygrophoropsis aurantiaca]
MAGSRFFPKSPAILSPTFPGQFGTGDQAVQASLGHLLSRAYTLPCSTAAQAFTQLVQPTSRFQLALDALLPLLNSSAELAQRILVSYILYSMYAPYPISINPFKSALFATFVKEREAAVKASKNGNFSENEQLVWVIWKILKGDGNDIGPYSPSTLSRSPLLPELRASNLFLDEDTFTESNVSDPVKPRQGETRNSNGRNPSEDTFAPVPLHETNISREEDERNERLAHGMKLLLAARDRVLTLTEQRILTPLIPRLTSPPMITSVDLPYIVANNSNLAYLLYTALLKTPSLDNSEAFSLYLDVLTQLPPTLPSFDLLGRLLRDTTTIKDSTTGGLSTVADLVRTEVLGRFLHESINWLDNAEREEKEGLISDDRFAKGVQNLCRFYNSLLKLGIVDADFDADATEMAHFALRHSRFGEANALYRVLAAGKF